MSKTEELRAAYARIISIDPCSPTYKKLCDFLDARTDKELKELSAADIKFVSGLAKNRLIRRGVK